jgi:hypothetical protein
VLRPSRFEVISFVFKLVLFAVREQTAAHGSLDLYQACGEVKSLFYLRFDSLSQTDILFDALFVGIVPKGYIHIALHALGGFFVIFASLHKFLDGLRAGVQFVGCFFVGLSDVGFKFEAVVNFHEGAFAAYSDDLMLHVLVGDGDFSA